MSALLLALTGQSTTGAPLIIATPIKRIIGYLKDWAAGLKNDCLALASAMTDPAVPTVARVLCLAVVAYAVSPIDLIPDFLPVVGYLDDLILIPLGIALVVRLIPPAVLETHRLRARNMAVPMSLKRWGTGIVIATWLLLAAVVIWAWL